MLNAARVLIVSPDAAQCADANEIVRHMGLFPVTCSSLTDARALTGRERFEFVLCNDDLPDCNLRTSLRVLTYSTGGVPVIILSHRADWDAYVRALNAGAFDYIACPPDPVETERIVRLAIKQNPHSRRSSRSAA
ncbi:MAG: response regulator [Candidatus Acidiferrales bacterium]